MERAHVALWAREQEFWLGGADVYRQHMADDAALVFPGMVLTKAQAIDSIANGARWTSVSFTEQRLVTLTPDAVVLIYRGSGRREPQAAPYSAMVSSVYVRRDGEWRLALHQQSPDGKLP